MSTIAAKNIDDPVLQWVTFRLENETYGINVMQVQEVLRYTEIAPVPGAPSYVLGIINLRGNVVTVIDTRKRFGLTCSDTTDQTRIVIIESDSQVIGILVDAVAEVVYLRQSEIEATPNVGNEDNAKFIQGVCHKNDELLILVDLEKFMTASTRMPMTWLSDSMITIRVWSVVSLQARPKRLRVSITVTTLPRRLMIPSTYEGAPGTGAISV